MVERFFMNSTTLIVILQECLDLRGKGETPIVDTVVQRFDADAVSNQPELAISNVPEGDCEHAPKPLDAVDSPLLKRMDDYLRVTVVCLEAVVKAFQFRSKFCMIVNLAIEHDPYRIFLVRHWLASRL